MAGFRFLDDSYFNNQYYAKVWGIQLEEMNALELDFLLRLDFRLHVLPEQFDAVCERLGRQLQPEDVEGCEVAQVQQQAERATAAA